MKVILHLAKESNSGVVKIKKQVGGQGATFPHTAAN